MGGQQEDTNSQAYFSKGRILCRMTRFVLITTGRSLKTVQKLKRNVERGHHWVAGVCWRKYQVWVINK